MAGDWIKVEHSLCDKPEVCQISEMLDIDPDAVVGKLIRFWAWCDSQTSDGNAITVTKMFIDRLTYQSGFSDALLKVDWLQARSGSFAVPRFDRHNGQTAKSRAETNRRVAKHRGKKQDGNEDVTEKLLQKPLPEKRREEKSNKKDKVVPDKRPPACPYDSIFDLFKELCPSLPQPRLRTGERKAAAKRIWKAAQSFGKGDDAKAWEFARTLFSEAESTPFLRGEKNGNSNNSWKADICFVSREEPMAKILEGRYR